jgi:hypothetical protein
MSGGGIYSFSLPVLVFRRYRRYTISAEEKAADRQTQRQLCPMQGELNEIAYMLEVRESQPIMLDLLRK